MHNLGTGNVSLPSLRHHRQARGLSLDELSLLSDIHKSTISRLENGITQAERRTVRDLARALKVKPEELMEEPESEDAEEVEGELLVS